MKHITLFVFTLAISCLQASGSENFSMHIRFLAKHGLSEKSGSMSYIQAYFIPDKSEDRGTIEFRTTKDEKTKILGQFQLESQVSYVTLSVLKFREGELLLVIGDGGYKYRYEVYGLNAAGLPLRLLDGVCSAPPFILSDFPKTGLQRLVVREVDNNRGEIQTFRIEENKFVSDDRRITYDGTFLWSLTVNPGEKSK